MQRILSFIPPVTMTYRRHCKATAIHFCTAIDVNDGHTASMSPDTRSLVDRLTAKIDFESSPVLWWRQRSALAQAITLIESTGCEKEEQASALLAFLLQNTSPEASFRIGFAGSPGAGKSSFIESFGKFILDRNTGITSTIQGQDLDENTNKLAWNPEKLAIVCIDPSSLRTGGSIMGDKTRMTTLAADRRVFIRPSAAQGALGGLAPRSDDVLRLLSQQYPLTFLETVGLGQSEVEVQQSVDMLVLAIPPGGGDDLQGVKKGIVEVADLIVVTKSDGTFLSAAKRTAGDYRGAMQFLSSITSHIEDNQQNGHEPTPVVLTSSMTGLGMESVWENICSFRQKQIESGRFKIRRQQQARYWVWKHLQVAVHELTENDKELQDLAKKIYLKLDDGIIPPRVAANLLFERIKHR